MHYVYMVRCADGTFYTGWTTDLENRVKAHNGEGRGQGARYTASRRPVELVYYEAFPTKSEALRREYAIKHMKKVEKRALIEKIS